MVDAVNHSYCAELVKQHDRDRFMAGLFVPMPQREALLAVVALNIELALLPDKISEEMIGHIRYAWWQENVEALYAGTTRHGQPVLEALAPLVDAGHLPQETLMPLIENYREHYPGPPNDIDAVLDGILWHVVQSICPGAEKGWHKAHHIIMRHRRRYRQANGWLALKLLLA